MQIDNKNHQNCVFSNTVYITFILPKCGQILSLEKLCLMMIKEKSKYNNVRKWKKEKEYASVLSNYGFGVLLYLYSIP